MLGLIAKAIGAKSTALDAIETALSAYFEKNPKVYFVLDPLDVLNSCEEGVVSVLRGLRDKFKYQLCFVYVYQEGKPLSSHVLPLLSFAPYKLVLGPLSRGDLVRYAGILAKRYGVKLSRLDIQKICDLAKGSPPICKELVLKKKFGEELVVNLDLDKEKLLEKSVKLMSKNEFLLFKALVSLDGQILSKDEMAMILSPESEGVGVSDAAISQAMKRVRQSCIANGIDVAISTKRGVGYYIEKTLTS